MSERRLLQVEHRLKAWPDSFAALAKRTKTMEFRKNDRDFCVGDWLFIEEWNPETSQFTGNVEQRRISHILTGLDYGVPEGFAVLSFAHPWHDSIAQMSRIEAEARDRQWEEAVLGLADSWEGVAGQRTKARAKRYADDVRALVERMKIGESSPDGGEQEQLG